MWKEQRKFAHSVLRDFGLGKSMLEDKIQEELTFFLDELANNSRAPFDPHDLVQMAVSNIIYAMVFGARYDYESPKFKRYMEMMNENFEILGNSGALTVFPFLKHLPGDIFRYCKLKSTAEESKQDFRDRISQHRATLTAGMYRDFIDAYLTEIEKLEETTQSTFHGMYMYGFIISWVSLIAKGFSFLQLSV